MNRRSAQSTFSSQRGAALLAALCFSTALVIALGGYLMVCYRSLQLSSRSLQNTRSLELAELGMEETIWTLNQSPQDWSAWTINGTTATKTLSGFTYDNGATGQATLTVTNYNATSGTRTVTVTGTTTLATGTQLSRTITSSASQAPLFVNALAATTGSVKLSAAGTSSRIDSYDSSKAAYASVATADNYSAVIASGSTSTAAATVQLTNAQVRGYVSTLSTGPSYSTSATLKSSTTPAATKIDSTRVSTSPYQPVFNIKTPTGAGTTLASSNPASNITLGTAGATTPTIYYSSGLDITNSIKITIAGPVQIVMSSGAAFYLGLHGGSPSIEIATTGSLEVFSSGDIAIYGGGINNLTQNATKCAIYSTNTLTVPDMSTTTAFYGVIYTPNGDFKVLGNNAIYGAIVARNVTFSGSTPTVHYDKNLRGAVFTGIETPYAVDDWRETTNGS